MDASCEPIDYPLDISQTAGDRSAQRLEVNVGERSLSVISNMSMVTGISAALCVVCAGIAWWAITENRVTIANYTRINEQNKALEERITKLENAR